MDESVWGRDAAVWKPERWADEDGAAQKAGPYSYMPFSRGPRDCIGARFAMLEAKTIISMLYAKFELEYAGDKPEEVLMSVTAHPKFGVPVRVKARLQQQQQQQQQQQEVVEQEEGVRGAVAASTPAAARV
jgi:cytochrome P450